MAGWTNQLLRIYSKTEENPVVESIEVDPTPKKSNEAVTKSFEASPTLEASSDESTKSTKDETLGDQESNDEPPEIKLEAAPVFFHFPTTNQMRHCFTRYVEYHRSVTQKAQLLYITKNQQIPHLPTGQKRWSTLKIVSGEITANTYLHIMWLLHLCEAHQEMQSWAEAAQYVVTVAGLVMHVASFGGSNINLSTWEDKKNPSESKEIVDVERSSKRERIRMNEARMGLLLRLDSVLGDNPTVRELRRDLSRRIVRLQEILDVVSDTKSQNWDGFLMDWYDFVERMEMDVCKERVGSNELEMFCAEHLGFQCLQRFLHDQ
ncbi:Cytochrome c oxidase subunit 6b-1 [Capsicum baccatum]|uniref:Cytochrome c oxidase subunit 6b-1 n=1 Tax=Capsicum baccatum TaxID=33114 RepID=A0A2G2W5H2_CAPBA|nr:Cytochrome c oxidase subunit 6b-1 [Capsicum baccatum]